MVNYWENQHLIDVALAVALALVAVSAPNFGMPAVIEVTVQSLVLSCRAWVGPALTLLGMMSATTAFIFSVIERGEFQPLKELGVEPQLWSIFSENLLWLGVAAVAAMLISLSGINSIGNILLVGVSFLFFIVLICLTKFVWVMRQVISVRASK